MRFLKRIHRSYHLFFLGALLTTSLSLADTFTNNKTGQVLYGYRTGQMEDGKAVVYTVQKGLIKMNLSEWTVSMNRLGRKDIVAVVEFEGPLELQVMLKALERAIVAGCQMGALFVVIEIDSPGGRTEYIERLCDLIIRIDYCPIIAFIQSGRYGGAVSTSAAVALACDEIYISPAATIGAASLVPVEPVAGNDGLSLAWEQYLATLARRRSRPGLLVSAMVDKDVSVIEVVRDGKRIFISPQQREPNDVFIAQWARGGELLTLTAAEAVQCGIAEAIVPDRAELLRRLDAVEAEVVVRDDATEAVKTFKKARLKFARLRRSLDANIKRLELTQNLAEAMTLLRQVKQQYSSLLLLARRYPDLYLDVELIEQQLESAEDYYEKAKNKQLSLDANDGDNTVGR